MPRTHFIKNIRYERDSNIDKWMKEQKNASSSIRYLIEAAIIKYGYNDLIAASLSEDMLGDASKVIDTTVDHRFSETKSENSSIETAEDIPKKPEEPTDKNDALDAKTFFGL